MKSSSTSVRSWSSNSSSRLYLTALCLEASAWILVPSRLIVPSFNTPARLCEQQHLDEEVLQLGQEGAPKRGQRIVAGVQVPPHEPKCHSLLLSPPDLPQYSILRC